MLNFRISSNDCGVSDVTVRRWLSVLEASYIVYFLHPFYKNFSKRLIKMPKIYFYDTGLACNLLEIENEQQLKNHYLKGGLYENMVISELLKGRLNSARKPNLYFWRDYTGNEIDLIAEWGGTLKAIEIKSSSTFQEDFTKNIHYFYALSKTKAPEITSVQGYVVYNGEFNGTLLATKIVPFKDIDSLLQD